jgi:hypothetical protein
MSAVEKKIFTITRYLLKKNKDGGGGAAGG